MFEDQDPAYGSVIDDPVPVVIPSQLTYAQYADLTGQEQLDWWSAGGTLT